MANYVGNKRGRKRIYPWSKWFSLKKAKLLVEGKDYQCSTRSMAVMLRREATVREVSISISLAAKSLTLKVHHA